MDRIQLRRDSSDNWAKVNPILLEGEVGFETDTKLRKIGDGVHRWNELEYLRAEGISQEIGNSKNITMSQNAITRELSKLGLEVNNEISSFKETVTNQVNNYKPIEIHGDVTNAADEEDITSDKDNLLKLKDRNNLNGMGYVILRKNKPFKEQITLTNTIYEIRYGFDLEGEEITIPDNCILKFEGGNLNNGTIIANNSIIEGIDVINCNVLGTFLDKNRKRKDVDFKYAEIATKPYLISTQSELNNILTRVENGETITANLNKGFYKLERSYNLTGTLHLQGNEDVYISYYNEVYKKNDAVEVINNHYKCPLKSKINDFSVFVHNNDIIKLSEISNNDTKVNSTKITIKDYDGEYFKLPITENFIEYSNIETFNNVFGWLDSLWNTIKFSVISSNDEYFYCKRISNTNVTTLNGDIISYNSTLNYVIYNLDIKDNEIYYDNDYIYIPNKYNYVEVINKSDFLLTARNGLYLNNINFVNIYSCIRVFNKNINTNIIGCSFTNILERAILVQGNKTSSDKLVNIIDCTFKNCAIVDSSIIYLQGSVDSKDSNVKIKNCDISQYTDGFTFYKNAGQGIVCYYPATIESCTIYNCVRGGLFLHSGKIEVRDCCLYNTDDFNYYQTRNYSRDLGMIYCGFLFKNDEEALNNVNNTILIERNRIYNFSGKGDTRGIFIDDGRGDVTCMYNVISDNESYSIDSRNVTSFSDGTVYNMSSIRNRLENNLCLTPYRLRYGSGVIGDNIPKSKNYVFNNVINDADQTLDTLLDIDSVRTKGAHIVSELDNKTQLGKLPYIEYSNSRKAATKKSLLFGNSPIVHISFDSVLIENNRPLVIKWNNTMGYVMSMEIIKYSEQIGFVAKCDGKYLAGRCNFYRDSNNRIDIYFAVCNEVRVINRNYGVLEYSNPHLNINIEFLDTFDFTEANLMYRTSLLNREFGTYLLPTVSDDEIKNIIANGAATFPPNELYTGDGTFYCVTRLGIRRTRGDSSNRPVLNNTAGYWGYQYFDTTLNKPIYWSSAGWVDATGTKV